MDVKTLFMDPTSDIVARHICYHPYHDIMVAGGILDSSAVAVFVYPVQPNGEVTLANHPYDKTKPEFLTPLTAIQAVRFSPDGQMLAVAGVDVDRDRVFVYHFTPSSEIPDSALRASKREVHSGGQVHRNVAGLNYCLSMFRKFDAESGITDVAWSPCGSFIAVACADGVVSILPVRTNYEFFQFESDAVRQIIKPLTVKVSTTAVYGLSWSPNGKAIVAQCMSCIALLVRSIGRNGVVTFQRSVKLATISDNILHGGLKFGSVAYSGSLITGETLGSTPGYPLFLEKGPEKYSSTQRRTMRTMYAISLYKRSPCWSPDGLFLVLPCGALPVLGASGPVLVQGQESELKSRTFCTYVYDWPTLSLLGSRAHPTVILPGLRCPSIDVSFSPVLYALTPDMPNTFGLAYQMLFAVASGCDVTVYSTQSFQPVFQYFGCSYQHDFITTLSWNSSGSVICAFGSHFEYHFIEIPLKILGADEEQLSPSSGISVFSPFVEKKDWAVVTEIESICDREQHFFMMALKREYAFKVLAYRSTLDAYILGKRQTRPSPPPKPFHVPIFEFGVRSFLAKGSARLASLPLHCLSTRLYDFELMPQPVLGISDEELQSYLPEYEQMVASAASKDLRSPTKAQQANDAKAMAPGQGTPSIPARRGRKRKSETHPTEEDSPQKNEPADASPVRAPIGGAANKDDMAADDVHEASVHVCASSDSEQI